MGAKIQCEKCNRFKDESTGFYKMKTGQRDTMCKECLTMHVNPDDPDTYVHIFKRYDIPYIPEEFEVLRTKAYAANPDKVSGMALVGKYISKMKLNQWKRYTWADTEEILKEREEKKIKQEDQVKEFNEQLKKDFEDGKITEAEFRTFTDVDTQKEFDQIQPISLVSASAIPAPQGNPFASASDFIDESELPSLGAKLSKEEKIKMALKWGTLYKPDEWVILENDYRRMKASFCIDDADTENALIQLCKTNLKANQALDIGDIQTYQQLARVQDTLRKSAKFTAVQNKEKKADFIDSIGQLVSFCEKNKGRIPRIPLNIARDEIDEVSLDQKEFLKTLVYEDTALAQEIEDYLKQRKIQEDRKRDKEEAKAKGLDSVPISDADYAHYLNEMQKQREQDEAWLHNPEEEDGDNI